MKSLNYGGSLKNDVREIFYVSIENIEQIEKEQALMNANKELIAIY